jgi:hypothetical protein
MHRLAVLSVICALLSACSTVGAPTALPRERLTTEECHLFVAFKGAGIYGDLQPAAPLQVDDLKARLPSLTPDEIQDLLSGPRPAVGVGRVRDCDASFGFAGSQGKPGHSAGGSGSSRPVFSRSGRLALIENWLSFGLLAGEGSVCLMRRDVDGTWRVETCGQTWVS